MFLGSRERPVRRAENLAAICEPIVQAMWDPQHLTTLQASAARYSNSFTFTFTSVLKVTADSLSICTECSIKTQAKFLPPERSSNTHFCYKLSKTQGHDVAGRIRSTEKKEK
jgi:hypothetical protein